MNHGKCENCWWWEPKKFDIIEARTVKGICWCWKNHTKWDSYCPDYWNRRKGERENGTLQNWIDSLPDTAVKPEGYY